MLWCNAIVIPSKESALITNDAIKTSAGHCIKSQFVKFIIYNGLLSFFRVQASYFFHLGKGEKSIYEYKFSGPKALIMGSEEDGISKNLIQLSNQVLKYP